MAKRLQKITRKHKIALVELTVEFRKQERVRA